MTFPFPYSSPYKTPLTLQRVHQVYDGTNTGSFSFPSCNFGAPASDRLIVGCISYRRNAALGISGITIGGVAAAGVIGSATATDDAYIFWARVPTGNSGTVAMTMNSSGADLVLYRITGQLSDTPVGSGYQTAGSPLSETITVGARAALISACSAGAGSNTWGGTAGIIPDHYLSPAASTADMGFGTAILLTTTSLGSVTVTHSASGASKMATAVWQ